MPSVSQTLGRERYQKMSGLDDLFEIVDRLDLEMRSKITVAALKQGAPVLVSATQSFAPVRTGALRESISFRVKSLKTLGTAVAIVGPRTGRFSKGKALGKHDSYKDSDEPARYAHLVEFGHATPKGFVSAKPFMRPAVVAVSDQIASRMAESVTKDLTRLAKKISKTGAYVNY